MTKQTNSRIFTTAHKTISAAHSSGDTDRFRLRVRMITDAAELLSQ